MEDAVLPSRCRKSISDDFSNSSIKTQAQTLGALFSTSQHQQPHIRSHTSSLASTPSLHFSNNRNQRLPAHHATPRIQHAEPAHRHHTFPPRPLARLRPDHVSKSNRPDRGGHEPSARPQILRSSSPTDQFPVHESIRQVLVTGVFEQSPLTHDAKAFASWLQTAAGKPA